MTLGKWARSLLIITLWMITVGLPMTAMADGLPYSPDNNNPGDSNQPGSDWPPKGARPKGNFIDGAFVGNWYAFVDNTAFTIVIEQDGRIIKGAHTAVYDYGRRVDSSFGGVSMVGTIEGSTAFVEWKSGLSPENGRATLEYIPGKPAVLHWKIVDQPPKTTDSNDGAPVEVSYFIPRTAYLIRK